MVFGLDNKSFFEYSDDFNIGEYIKNGIIEIVSAVRRRDGTIEVRISASRILSEFELRSIDREIGIRLHPANAECIFDFGSALAVKKFDAQTLRELWSEFSPQLEPILRICRITGDDANFTAAVPPRYMLALSGNFVSDFRAHLSSVYS